MDAIETRGLTKTYGGGTVGIADLDLRVRPGETVAFVGPNGAGKTTTIRLLLDLLRPTRGSARVLGLDARRSSMEVRRRTGFLPGDLVLYGSLRGRETLDLFARLRGGHAPRQAELLERVRLGGKDLRRRVRGYSTGMRRKLGLVLALQHDPELAILDEPTTGLDPLVRRACHDAIRGWHGGNRALFLSSHDMGEVDRLCDRVLVVRDGRLVAERSVQELRESVSPPRTLEDAILDFYGDA